MHYQKHIYPLLVALALMVGLWVRLARFPHQPPGFNQDEASSAYEAFSLATTGLDRWGNAWPAYFPSWGSGQNVLLAYLTVPVVKCFGLNVFTARVVSLALAILTLPLLWWALRPLGRFSALLGTWWLALMPWHFMLAHWALESNLVPFFMLLGCGLLVRALTTQQRRWILGSLLPFALSLYAYGTTMLVLPVLGSIVAMFAWPRLRAQAGAWLLAVALSGAVALPFLLFFIENYIVGHNMAWTDHLPFATPLLPATRMSQVTSGNWAATFAQNYRFLLASFDDGSCYNLMPGFKLLLSPTLPLGLLGAGIGAFRLWWRSWRNAGPRQLTLLVFGAWALASLTLFVSFDLNVNRFNHFYLPCLVLAVWLVDLAIRSLRPEVPRLAVRLGIMGWLAFEGGVAVQHYYTAYRHGPIRQQFNAGLDEAFAAVKRLPPVPQICISQQMPLPYMYALFYLAYPPAQFQHEVQVSTDNGTYQVRRFGKYIFDTAILDTTQIYGYLARRQEFSGKEVRREIIFTNDDWEVGMMQPTAP